MSGSRPAVLVVKVLLSSVSAEDSDVYTAPPVVLPVLPVKAEFTMDSVAPAAKMAPPRVALLATNCELKVCTAQASLQVNHTWAISDANMCCMQPLQPPCALP